MLARGAVPDGRTGGTSRVTFPASVTLIVGEVASWASLYTGVLEEIREDHP